MFIARPQPSRASAAGAPARLGTPLWSARRVPQSVVEAIATQKLVADVAGTLKGLDASCAIVEAPGLGVLTATQAEKPLIGASSQKLLTATAALGVLGPDYRYATRAVTSGKPSASVDKLWLIGGGDPVLHTPAYQAAIDEKPSQKGNAATAMTALADGIAAKGIRNINTLLVDDSRYDDVRYLPTWKPTYKTEGQVGSLGALIVNSGFASWDGTRVPADDPALDAGSQLASLLKDRGITVGAVARGTSVGDTSEVVSVASPPLRDIVGEMLRVSDNTTAEMLVREMAVKSGRSGSTQAGIETVTNTLSERGIPMKGVTLLDGSGLSRDNQLTCGALQAAIGLGRVPGPGELTSLLAVAGESGTLAGRFQGTPLQGKLRAKTGNLAGVTALGGLVETYRPIPFSFVADGAFTEPQGAQLQSQIATAIARFPAGPPASALVPTVAPPCTQPACR